MYIYFSFIVDGWGIHLAELVSACVVPAAKWSMEMRKYDCPRLLLEISQKLREQLAGTVPAVACSPEHRLQGTGDWTQLTRDAIAYLPSEEMSWWERRRWSTHLHLLFNIVATSIDEL